VYGALAALREWETRAAERLRAGQYPGLDSTVTLVAAQRAAAEAALDAGDRRAAAGLLAQAGETARAYSPVRVALRLVERAEQRIDADPSPTHDLRRARLLLRTAREAMATGDQMRAMKRAWYAQQIIDAHDAGRVAPP
jgi:Cdc6-like AAA superfamily ATPase